MGLASHAAQMAAAALPGLRGKPAVYEYERIALDLFGPAMPGVSNYPCLVPNWDNTPRSGAGGMVYHGATPELFDAKRVEALSRVRTETAMSGFVFIKSWNEWAEGNHLEPDLRFGHRFLEVVRDVFGPRGRHAHDPGIRPIGTSHRNRTSPGDRPGVFPTSGTTTLRRPRSIEDRGRLDLQARGGLVWSS